jgi:hypothetical protein
MLFIVISIFFFVDVVEEVEVDDEVDDEVEDDEDDDENDDENDGFVGEEDCVTLLLVVFISTICLSSLIHGLQRRLR